MTRTDCPISGADELQRAMVAAARQVLEDESMMAAYWSSGYKALKGHAASESTTWVGEKVWVLIRSALVGLGLFLIYKFGLVKW